MTPSAGDGNYLAVVYEISRFLQLPVCSLMWKSTFKISNESECCELR